MSAPELALGYVVAGKYTIRSVLLRGGTTTTYRAVGAKNRDVVVKLYDPAIQSFPDLLKTLAEHRSVGAKLPPHQIVSITDSGTDMNSGAPFTVTDFESVPSLAQLIDRGPLSASAMAAFLRNLASVTDLLHANRITSLALHPGNVFVRAEQYDVRVADFGASLIRRALPAPERAARWMPWLAPEQIKGQDTGSLAADVFALALIAFYSLTGRSYWRSSQQKVPDTAALRREILGERMPASVRASEFSITLNPAVDAVFARALAFRPTDRYSSAGEFAASLGAALIGRSAADAQAREPGSANFASVKGGAAGSAAHRAPQPSDPSLSAQRMAAPPPRKMPHRATMVGLGTLEDEEPTIAIAPGARPPMRTMLGMGEATAEALAAATAKANAPATAPAKISPPALPTAPAMGAPAARAGAPVGPAAPAKPAAPQAVTGPAKQAVPQTTAIPAKPAAPAAAPAAAKPSPPAIAPTPAKASPPAMSTAQAKPAAPQMAAPSPKAAPPGTAVPTGVIAPAPVIAIAPTTSPARVTAARAAILAEPAMSVAAAISADAPVVNPSVTSTKRGVPPPLPMAPPAQLEEVLAQFEAPPQKQNRLPEALPLSSTGGLEVVQTPPLWTAAGYHEPGSERVETDVALVGAATANAPKNSRLRWVAAVSGLLIVAGGAALALSAAGPSGNRASTASSDTKATAAPLTATEAPSVSADPPSAMVEPQGVNAGTQGTEEIPEKRAIEPVLPALPAEPAAKEPVAAEPAAPPPAPPSTAAGTAAPVVDDNAPAQPAIAHGSGHPSPASPPAPAGPRTQPSKKPCGKFLKRCD